MDTVERALFAFWEVIAKEHPEIEGGDLPPDVAIPFDRLARETVDHWKKFNSDEDEGE